MGLTEGVEVCGIVVAAVGTALWARSARMRWRAYRSANMVADASTLALAAFRQHLHATFLWAGLTVAEMIALASADVARWATPVLVVPAAILTVLVNRTARRDALLFLGRLSLERRAEEALSQGAEAPRQWAERLMPAQLPEVTGWEAAHAHQAGAGLMTGDMIDVVDLGDGRTALVVGDATGHGTSAAITAMQVKYLLRAFLRLFRDPAQVLEELNRRVIDADRGEEMMSVWVGVVDASYSTLRFASAGHPTCWLLQDREVKPLEATGPLLMLDAGSSYVSHEVRVKPGDLLLAYSDGLIEARRGDQLLGEERVVGSLRREAGSPPAVIGKTLLDEAVHHTSGRLVDDVTILVARRR